MHRLKISRSRGAYTLGFALLLAFVWSCALASTAYAQDDSDIETEKHEALRRSLELKKQLLEAGQLKAREHPIVMNVRGVPLKTFNRDCALLVQKALRQNQELPTDDEECEELMIEALEIQRTVPPLTPTGPPAQRFGRSEGYTRALEDEGAESELAPPEPTPPPAGQPPRVSFGKSVPK